MADTKIFTLAEVVQISSSNKPLIVINNAVYDVTNFLNEHPGGEEVLLEQAGKDATEQFEDVGHSSDAREMMLKYKVGELAESDRKKETPKEKPKWETPETDNSNPYLRPKVKGEIILGTMDQTFEYEYNIPENEVVITRTAPGYRYRKSSWATWVIPAALALAATVLYRFFFSK